MFACGRQPLGFRLFDINRGFAYVPIFVRSLGPTTDSRCGRCIVLASDAGGSAHSVFPQPPPPNRQALRRSLPKMHHGNAIRRRDGRFCPGLSGMPWFLVARKRLLEDRHGGAQSLSWSGYDSPVGSLPITSRADVSNLSPTIRDPRLRRTRDNRAGLVPTVRHGLARRWRTGANQTSSRETLSIGSFRRHNKKATIKRWWLSFW